MSLQELAKKQTKSIDAPIVDKEVVEHDNDNESGAETNSPSSISEIANLLKNRSSEKGDK